MAGFQVAINGRFWVATEAVEYGHLRKLETQKASFGGDGSETDART
jgi:hypothetical protein